MSDPAVEAAQRAWAASEQPFIPTMSLEQAAIAAAREALAPIRDEIELIERSAAEAESLSDNAALFYDGIRFALRDIKRHVYPSEEL